MSFPKRRAKGAEYNNVASTCSYGHSHRSRLEGAVCQMIYFREKAGELKLLQVEATVYMTEAKYKYIPDFKCLDLKTNQEIYIEAKGFANPRWPTTKKLWKFYGLGPLEIWGGTHTRPVLIETIIPKTTVEQT